MKNKKQKNVTLDKLIKKLEKNDDNYIGVEYQRGDKAGTISFIQYPIAEKIHFEIIRRRVYLDFEYKLEESKRKIIEIIGDLEKDNDFKYLWKNHKSWVRIGFKKQQDSIDLSTLNNAINVIEKLEEKIIKKFKDKIELLENILNENNNSELLQIDLFEGKKSKITVNHYERNADARKLCIERNGCFCNICGFNFKEVYGDIGADFIHVHHIIKISERNKPYKVDIEKDLIPVCPNCHAMLHKKNDDGETLAIEQLKEKTKKKILKEPQNENFSNRLPRTNNKGFRLFYNCIRQFLFWRVFYG